MEHPQSFIRRYVFSTDHKVIGIQYIVTGLVMAGVGALLAVMINRLLFSATWRRAASTVVRATPRIHESDGTCPVCRVARLTFSRNRSKFPAALSQKDRVNSSWFGPLPSVTRPMFLTYS